MIFCGLTKREDENLCRHAFWAKNILLYEPSKVQKRRIEGYEDFNRFLID